MARIGDATRVAGKSVDHGLLFSGAEPDSLVGSFFLGIVNDAFRFRSISLLQTLMPRALFRDMIMAIGIKLHYSYAILESRKTLPACGLAEPLDEGV